MKAELLIHLPEMNLAEGPVWDHRDQTLWWVDILEGNLYNYHPEARSHSSFAVGQYLGAAVPREKGGFVLALAEGFAFFDPDTRQLDFIHDPEADKPGNRFNDGKVDPAGRFWAGTTEFLHEEVTGSLYCLSPETMNIQKTLSSVHISNGLAWTKDAQTFYFIDSPTQQVQAFDFDLPQGSLSNGRIVLDFAPEMGTPDGMSIDDHDHLWIAFWGGSKVACFDPISGKQLDQIDVPAVKTTSCTFGGPDRDTLFITSAAKEGDPYGGAIFSAKPGVKGPLSSFFAG